VNGRRAVPARGASGAAARVGRIGLAVAALAACAGAVSSCGGVQAADLFAVTRTGPAPAQRLTLVVNEEGGVRCDGRAVRKLADAQLVQAHAIQEELEKPASSGLSLPPLPGSVFSYVVQTEKGIVRFSDNSPGKPKAVRSLILFVLQVAQGNCGLPA
jgi:hypothetical protein